MLTSLLGILMLSRALAAEPIVIAHRGHPGTLPDHTLEGYTKAVELGADYIEPDLVSTKDHVLVARHDVEIGGTTDAAAKFPERRTTKTIDGEAITGWFVDDFTLAELQTLRARQPSAERPKDHDGKYAVPTFDQILDLRDALSKKHGRTVGVYPETKHPTYFREQALALEERMLASLAAHGLSKATDPVFIQSFEVGNLEKLDQTTELRLMQLVWTDGAPWDRQDLPYAEMVTPAGLARIATYAQALGPHKDQLIPRGDDGRLGEPTSLVADAHAAGLLVHAYTFRSEAGALPTGTDPVSEVRRFFEAGVDGVFCDQAEVGAQARDALREGP